MVELFGVNYTNTHNIPNVANYPKVDVYQLEVKFFTYSGGEEFVRIVDPKDALNYSVLVVRAFITNSTDLMRVLLLKNAIDKLGTGKPVYLIMPYIPYARQDRVCHPGEPFSLEVFANLINPVRFDKIFAYDPHSEVSKKKIWGLVPITQHQLFSYNTELIRKINSNIDRVALLCPDKGARERTQDLAQRFGIIDIVYCDKIRDPQDGSITGTNVNCEPGHLNDKIVFLFDDICDGGRTFIEIAKEVVKNHTPSELNLAVTHGIMSKGFNPIMHHMEGLFDNVYLGFYFGKQEELADNVYLTNHQIPFLF